jgi:subtilisin
MFISALVATLCFVLFPLSVDASSTNEYVVKFEESKGLSKAMEVAKGQKFEVLKTYEDLDYFVVKGSPNSVKKLKNKDGILEVYENVTYTILGKPTGDNPNKPSKDEPDPTTPPTTDDFESFLWGLRAVGAKDYWVNSKGSGVKVAIIDTGIDMDHEDLVGNIDFVNSKNTISSRKTIEDDNGHGTHVAGTIAALDNQSGVLGVAPDATLIVYKSLDRKGSGSGADISAAIDYAIAAGADVINMSLGSAVKDQLISDAVDRAYNAGVIVVCANGNENTAVSYPAALDKTIAVSALKEDTGVIMFDDSYSNFGPQTTVAAPGSNIGSTYKDGGYVYMDGTSMASPHVAGVVALLIGAHGDLNHDQVVYLLQVNVNDLGTVGFDDYYGYGAVNLK